jgi:hypothetical protein
MSMERLPAGPMSQPRHGADKTNSRRAAGASTWDRCRCGRLFRERHNGIRPDIPSSYTPRDRPHIRPSGFPACHCRGDSLRNSSGSPDSGLYTSTNLCCPKFRDHVNFDACAEWHLRHIDGTARAALRAWMPRSPNTWTSSSDAPATTRRGSVKFGAPLTMTKSFAILRLIINGSGASRDFGLVKTPWRIEGP